MDYKTDSLDYIVHKETLSQKNISKLKMLPTTIMAELEGEAQWVKASHIRGLSLNSQNPHEIQLRGLSLQRS